MDTTTKTNINYNAQYCINRLPCGYCTLLSRACPMLPTTILPTWEITYDGLANSDSTKWAQEPNAINTAENAKEGSNGN